MVATRENSPTKQARLAVRLTPQQDALIRDAAAATGQTLTDFVMSAAVARAEEALADRRLFRLSDLAWTQFTMLLDEPGRPIPELVDLLNDPAPWDTAE